MKIVVLDGYAGNPGDLSWAPLEALGDVTIHDRIPHSETVARIGDAEAILTNKAPITREVLDACPNLKYVGVLATGYNVVDTAAAKERGVVVTNIPAYSTDAVAQFTFALLLEICHHVGHHSDAVHAGRWERSSDFCFWDFPLIELAGKTMGIIGFGRIGRSVGRIARTMGMKVVAHSPHPCDEGREIAEYVSLDELYARSDVISLHCPLFPATAGLINAESIAKMKDGVILLNTGRGPLIVEQDVADALKRGKIYAAAMDVVSREPIEGANPLLTAPNCIITPHIAWAADASRARLMDIAVKNLKAFIEGNPINVVNP